MVGGTRRAARPWEDEDDTIQLLRETDLHLLETKQDHVQGQLMKGLLGRVPLPPRAAAAGARGVLEGKEDEDESEGNARRRLLVKEVTGFVGDLKSLLQTRYFVSPVTARGETPADMVGAKGVIEEASKGTERGSLES